MYGLYDINHLNLLCGASGQFGKAVGVVDKALSLMRVYHSPNHPDISELELMKTHIST